MKKTIYLLSSALMFSLLMACGGGENKTEEASTNEPVQSMVADPVSYDPKRGEGKFSEENVTIGALDAAMAAKGEAISSTKCTSCHKLSEEKLVGPGWKGGNRKKNSALDYEFYF
jgi:mono/diheme cytochrome c family protein